MPRPSPHPSSPKSIPPFLTAGTGGVSLSLKVLPRAKRTGLEGVLGDTLKLSVTAPPVDAAANAAVVEFLAGLLDCPRGAVRIVRGATSRRKVVRVTGVPLDRVIAALAPAGRPLPHGKKTPKDSEPAGMEDSHFSVRRSV